MNEWNIVYTHQVNIAENLFQLFSSFLIHFSILSPKLEDAKFKLTLFAPKALISY